MTPRQPASAFKLGVLALAAVVAVAGLASLGVWQLQRLAWKQDLIRRVDARIHAAPVAAPDRAHWSSVNAASSEYLRVYVQGRYQYDRETRVQAVTIRGSGFWVMTPLQTADGTTMLVNRGFVSPQYQRVASPEEQTTVTGLLRLSETGKAFLRSNQPAADRWYARDVAAIAAARGLTDVAPYFIDAAASEPQIPGEPEGGLTVVAFGNDHLEYALTWFALALLLAGGSVLVFRHELHLRRQTTS